MAEEEALKQELSHYLLDPKNFFIGQKMKDISKAQYKLKDDQEFAQERFKRDISVLNFFFDTPIITQIGLEMRVSMFDKLSAIGGTLGLYTGISIITIVETIWWLIRFVIYAVRRKNYKKPYNNNIVSIVRSTYNQP